MGSKAVTLLVLGVGGNVSQGILKALAASNLDCRIIGACVDARSVGLYLCDHALVSPFATEPEFVDWLTDACLKFEVSGILCGVEAVLTVLASSRKHIEERTGARIIVSSPEALEICGDKLRTANWLRERKLNFPQSVDAQDEAGLRSLRREYDYPLFAKPRAGKSSQGIMKISSDAELSSVIGRQGYVVQQYLGKPSEEFTAATFTDMRGDVRGCIVFRRQLLEGTTVSAEVVNSPAVRSEVLAIARALRPVGPCNMQLRLLGDRPVCFEINLRYSGTTPIRARLGFNDVEAGVRHYVLGEKINDLPQVTRGVALRFWSEVYIDEVALESCMRDKMLLTPRTSLKFIEAFGGQR